MCCNVIISFKGGKGFPWTGGTEFRNSSRRWGELLINLIRGDATHLSWLQLEQHSNIQPFFYLTKLQSTEVPLPIQKMLSSLFIICLSCAWIPSFIWFYSHLISISYARQLSFPFFWWPPLNTHVLCSIQIQSQLLSFILSVI